MPQNTVSLPSSYLLGYLNQDKLSSQQMSAWLFYQENQGPWWWDSPTCLKKALASFWLASLWGRSSTTTFFGNLPLIFSNCTLQSPHPNEPSLIAFLITLAHLLTKKKSPCFTPSFHRNPNFQNSSFLLKSSHRWFCLFPSCANQD